MLRAASSSIARMLGRASAVAKTVRFTTTTVAGPTTVKTAAKAAVNGAAEENANAVTDAWKKMLNSDLYSGVAFAGVALGAGAAFVYRCNKDVPEGDTRSIWQRTWDRIMHAGDSLVMPSRMKLLPDFPAGFVGSKEGTLVHSTWDRNIGAYKTVKRPGVDLFLAKLAPFYEIVVFTSSLPNVADPIVDALDPTGSVFRYRLYRDSTTFKRGYHVKDLSRINRDPSRIVFLDGVTLPESVQPSPENRVPGVAVWKGNADDRTLVDAIPLLENIATHRHVDVRPLFEKLSKHPDPLAAFNGAYIHYLDTMGEKLRGHSHGHHHDPAATSYFDVAHVREHVPRGAYIQPFVFDETASTHTSSTGHGFSLWSYLGF